MRKSDTALRCQTRIKGWAAWVRGILSRGKTHLLIEVCARLGVGDLGFQEGACAHLDVHHTWIVEVIQ